MLEKIKASFVKAEKVVNDPKKPITKKLFKKKELPSSWFAIKKPIAKHPIKLTIKVPKGMPNSKDCERKFEK